MLSVWKNITISMGIEIGGNRELCPSFALLLLPAFWFTSAALALNGSGEYLIQRLPLVHVFNGFYSIVGGNKRKKKKIIYPSISEQRAQNEIHSPQKKRVH